VTETFVQSTDDVVKFLKGQHNLIYDMFDEVLHASEPKAREKAFIDLRQLLAVHETAEEMVVHPRARREIKDGDSVVDARLEEEHEAKEQLSKIEDLDIGSQEFIDALTRFRDAVVDHAEHEESSISCSASSTPMTSSEWQEPCEQPRPSPRRVRTPVWNRPKLTLPPDRSRRCSTAPET